MLTREYLLKAMPKALSEFPPEVIEIIVNHAFPIVNLNVHNVSRFPIRFRTRNGNWHHLYPKCWKALACAAGDTIEFGCGTTRVVRSTTKCIIAHYSNAPLGSTPTTMYV